MNNTSSSEATKPCIFVSHIAHEKDIAIALKDLIEDYFVQTDVFVSSEPDDNGPGNNWFETIFNRLRECAAVIVICSEDSVSRPWVNFEAGAGWIRKIPIIPVCHSGMKPDQLPMPLHVLQGILIDDPTALNSLIGSIAKILNTRLPKVNFDEFLEKVAAYQDIRSGKKELLKVYPTSREIQSRFGEIIGSARQEIVLCGVQFAVSLSDWRKEYLEALQRGVTIRLAVLDPDSPDLITTAISYGVDAEELRDECRDSINKINRFGCVSVLLIRLLRLALNKVYYRELAAVGFSCHNVSV